MEVVFDREWIEEQFEHFHYGNGQPIQILLPRLRMKQIRFRVYQQEWAFYQTICAIVLSGIHGKSNRLKC